MSLPARSPIKNLRYPGGQIMSGRRTVRFVAPDWRHPLNEKNEHIPLCDNFTFSRECWQYAEQMWTNGMCVVPTGHPTYGPYVPKGHFYDVEASGRPYTSIADACPVQEDYVVDRPLEERTCFQYYETVTMGTPRGAIYTSVDDLIEGVLKYGDIQGVDEYEFGKMIREMVAEIQASYDVYALARSYIQTFQPIPDHVWEQMRAHTLEVQGKL